MKRLAEKMVLSALTTAWLRAALPTLRSPLLGSLETTDGTVLLPSAEGMMTGWPPSIKATAELVVPRSIPITLPMMLSCSLICRSFQG